MKKFLLLSLIILKNATIIIPLFEGVINALVNMIENDKTKKEKK